MKKNIAVTFILLIALLVLVAGCIPVTPAPTVSPIAPVAQSENEEEYSPLAFSNHNTTCYQEDGKWVASSGCEWELQSGSTLDIQSGATFSVAGTQAISTATVTTGTLTSATITTATITSLVVNGVTASGVLRYGSATVVSGTTIAHGLATTPTYLALTPYYAGAFTQTLYAQGADSTVITVALSSGPITTTTAYWSAGK